jgi:uncharacterized protein
MKIEGPAVRLTIFVGEDDTWHHNALHRDRAPRPYRRPGRRERAARHRRLRRQLPHHTTRLLSLSEDLPIAVITVDAEEKIRAFLPQLDDLVTEGLVILDPVEVIRYVGRTPESAR